MHLGNDIRTSHKFYFNCQESGGPSGEGVPSMRSYFVFQAEASVNILPNSVTEPTSHPERSWLKEFACWNMKFMFVTELTSHPEMSELKAFA